MADSLASHSSSYDEKRPQIDKRLKEKMEYYGGGHEDAHKNGIANSDSKA